jgi:phosphatidate phosphatase PAH1
MFKTVILQKYLDQGWRLAYAYGDSLTDFYAYASAGIPRNQVFALLREGETQCQDGIYEDCLIGGWEEHLSFIREKVPNTK